MVGLSRVQPGRSRLIEVFSRQCFVEAVDVVAEMGMASGISPSGEIDQVDGQFFFQRDVLLAVRGNAVDNGLLVPFGLVTQQVGGEFNGFLHAHTPMAEAAGALRKQRVMGCIVEVDIVRIGENKLHIA